MNTYNRRNFLKTSIMGGVAFTSFGSVNAIATFGNQEHFSASVALTSGDNRADIAFRALHPFSKQIKQAVGKKLVVLKPNIVYTDIPLSSTHVETLEGVLEFFKSINKLENIIIAESSAHQPTIEGFNNYGYYRLINKYPVKLVDLDQKPFDILYVFNEKDFRPHAVRVSRILLDPNSYIVSVARMKTHDLVVATLSLKNIVFGAPIKDLGFTWGPNCKPGAKHDKSIVHGGGYRGTNYNLYVLAHKLHPHLSVIDGFEGMEGNGPGHGTPVDHRVCVASTDWLAADRVGIELMGIDFSKVGYLNYCAQTKLGVADLNQIEIIGEKLSNHIKSYKLRDNIDAQMIWMSRAS
jgi:uncharacterized protein (DUF362 family)